MGRAKLLLLLLVLNFGCRSLQQESDDTNLLSIGEQRLLSDLHFLDAESQRSDSLNLIPMYVGSQMQGLHPVQSAHPVHYWSWGGQDGHNVMTYVAGRHPDYSSDLVIVGTDLDGKHRQGVMSLMEIARRYSEDASRGFLPDRTILLAAFSGSRSGYTGLKRYMETPGWNYARVVAMVFIAPSDSVSLARAAENAGIPLTILAEENPDSVSVPLAIAEDAFRLVGQADEMLRTISVVEIGAPESQKKN